MSGEATEVAEGGRGRHSNQASENREEVRGRRHLPCHNDS